MRKKSILAVFLIIILLLAGCGSSQEVSVSDQLAQTKSIVKKAVKTAQKSDDNKVSDSAKSAGKDLDEFVTGTGEPKSETSAVSPSGSGEKVRLVVTRDYGKVIIFNQQVAVQQQDALSLTAAHLDVKTSYGGAFINSINGLESGYTGKIGKREKSDWFFYFNGVLAGRGAGDIQVKTGDAVWWDYHDWGSSTFTPAMIGAFPHPFANGVILAYSPAAQGAANQLAAGLGKQGIKQVQLQEVTNETVNKRQRPVILLGLREEIIVLPAIQTLNSNLQRAGLFCGFTDNGFKLLNTAMQEGRTVAGGGCACIEATANSMGDANPLWLVIAEDERGLERAVNYLSSGSINPDCAWGVMLEPQGVTPLPLR